MNNYVTGKIIKELREKKGLTQLELANVIGVSDKAISEWETSKGLPDITLIEPLAKALNISIIELISGDYVINNNKASNIEKSKLYVCPICGNIIHSMGKTVITCCGIVLPELEAEEVNDTHKINIKNIEDELLIRINHEMTKEHYISFIAYSRYNKFEIIKLYAEGENEVRIPDLNNITLYIYCNKHGLMKQKI